MIFWNVTSKYYIFSRVAAKQYFNNFVKHKILKKLFRISQHFVKFPKIKPKIFAKLFFFFLEIRKRMFSQPPYFLANKIILFESVFALNQKSNFQLCLWGLWLSCRVRGLYLALLNWLFILVIRRILILIIDTATNVISD